MPVTDAATRKDILTATGTRTEISLKEVTMKVQCELASQCSYLKCKHHRIHEEDEECLYDGTCQEFDTCREPGDVVYVECVPVVPSKVEERREEKKVFIRKEIERLEKVISELKKELES